MTEKLLAAINAKYNLIEQDPGSFKKLKANGMTFHIRTFRAEGLGWVSLMGASGFFGLMKMDTLIINPMQADMPLLSYDRVYAMGNDTLIFELYDTLIGEADLGAVMDAKAAHAALPEHDLGKHWYDDIKLPESISKKGKKNQTAAFDALTEKYMDAFLRCCQSAAPSETAQKRANSSVYVEGLLSHGGPSTDVFKKAIGEDKTAQLFRYVLFGTKA